MTTTTTAHNDRAHPDHAAIREAFAKRPNAAPLAAIPLTMGRYGTLTPRPRVTIQGEGKKAVATVTTPAGITFTINAEDWRRLIEPFNGAVPAIFWRSNGRGRRYLGIVLPPGPGETEGRTAMVARVIVGAEAEGHHIRYRDGNTLNLTRANLNPIERGVAAAMAGAN
jgi:hypothetical protein